MSNTPFDTASAKDSLKRPQERMPKWAIIIGVFILIYVAGFIVVALFVKKDAAAAAQFGDSFGTMNAFFSACATCLLIIGLLHQMGELRLSIEEFRKTTEAHQESVSINRRATLFQGIDLHNRLTNEKFSVEKLINFEVERQRVLSTFTHRFTLELQLNGLWNEVSNGETLLLQTPSTSDFTNRRDSASAILNIATSLDEAGVLMRHEAGLKSQESRDEIYDHCKQQVRQLAAYKGKLLHCDTSMNIVLSELVGLMPTLKQVKYADFDRTSEDTVRAVSRTRAGLIQSARCLAEIVLQELGMQVEISQGELEKY